jgi:hypothetical protein
VAFTKPPHIIGTVVDFCCEKHKKEYKSDNKKKDITVLRLTEERYDGFKF